MNNYPRKKKNTYGYKGNINENYQGYQNEYFPHYNKGKKYNGHNHQRHFNGVEREIPSEPTQQKKQKDEIDTLIVFPGEIYPIKSELVFQDAFKISKGNLLTLKPTVIQRNGENLHQDINILNAENKDKENEKEKKEKEKVINIRSCGKIYIPKEGDLVIGIVKQKFGDFYTVDIGTYTNAMLNKNNTEGNKNSKLNLEIGDLIIARVIEINKNDSPSLSTEKIYTRNTMKTYTDLDLGKLDGGNLYDLPIFEIYRFDKRNVTLKRIKQSVNCSIVIGANGKAFINTEEERVNWVIYDIIKESLDLDDKNGVSADKIIEKCNKVFEKI